MNNLSLQDQVPAKKYRDDLFLRCYDPYGFWRFEDEDGDTGEVPERLSGMFTTITSADAAYDSFLISLGEKPASVPDVKPAKNKKAKNKDVTKPFVDNTPIF